jgi:hypothetical protein
MYFCLLLGRYYFTAATLLPLGFHFLMLIFLPGLSLLLTLPCPSPSDSSTKADEMENIERNVKNTSFEEEKDSAMKYAKLIT